MVAQLGLTSTYQPREFSDKDVFEHVSELFSIQTYNPHSFDTLKFLEA